MNPETNNRNILLRRATPADISLLTHWDAQPHVLNADPNDSWDWESELSREFPWREQLIAELNGRPIGFIQIIDPALEESHYWGEVENDLRAIDIWIGEADDLGRGYGTVMMRLAIERCFESPAVHAILLDPLASNTKAHRFYEKSGFRFIRQQWFGNDHCFVYRLERNMYIS